MSRVPYTAAVPLIESIYSRHSAGCCLHIVIDDGNWDSLDWCLEQPDICDECRECALILKTMTVTAMKKACRKARYET
jgi:hypothetical protein